MKSETIKIPIYGGRLTMILCDSLQEVNNKYHFNDDVSYYRAVVFTNKALPDLQHVVFEKVNNPSVITHEAVHIVNHIFNRVGIKLDSYNDEAQAYLTQWAFDECYKFLHKNKGFWDSK